MGRGKGVGEGDQSGGGKSEGGSRKAGDGGIGVATPVSHHPQGQGSRQSVDRPGCAHRHAHAQQKGIPRRILAETLPLIVNHKRGPIGLRQRRGRHAEAPLGEHLSLEPVGSLILHMCDAFEDAQRDRRHQKKENDGNQNR